MVSVLFKTERQKDSKTERQKKRQRERQTEGQKDRKAERQKDRKTERQKDKKTERQKDRKTERQKDRKTERQKDRKTERQKDEILVQAFNQCGKGPKRRPLRLVMVSALLNNWKREVENIKKYRKTERQRYRKGRKKQRD